MCVPPHQLVKVFEPCAAGKSGRPSNLDRLRPMTIRASAFCVLVDSVTILFGVVGFLHRRSRPGLVGDIQQSVAIPSLRYNCIVAAVAAAAAMLYTATLTNPR